ncbi:MAG: T9SS type A sorting domain-containing protein [Bacteroidota bacterium]
MKTTLVACLIFSLPSIAQVVYIPDANFKTALLNNAAINTNADTSIQVSEALAYTGGINVLSHSIHDMTGIAAFVNVTSINCYNNQLTSLDLSANTLITSLGCSTNQITSLDLSSNTLLTNITCSNNQLTSLNVSTCTGLTELYCSSNQLTSLDVSNNTALTILYCFINQLTSLNLSSNLLLTDMYSMGNPNLRCIQVPDVAAATANQGWMKDATSVYAVNCNEMGVSSPNLETITVFPNPVSTSFIIKGLLPEDEWKIYDLVGQVNISPKKENSTNNEVDIRALSRGVYFIRVNHQKQVNTFKLLKE